MLSLREVQEHFRAAVFESPQELAPDFIVAGALTVEQRMAVYRGSVFGNLRSALRGVYPVVDRLVGAEFFDFATEHFIRATPSPSGDIHQFGREFAEFLRAFPPAAGLPYLPDAARLEWLMHELHYQPELPPLDLASLATLPEAARGELGFSLNPACRLLASPYPIDLIWQANQPEIAEPGQIEIDSGAVRLLLRRRSGTLELQRLDEGGYLLLEQLHEGAPFSAALERVLTAQAGFDAAPFLLQQVQLGTLAAFHQLRREAES